MSHVYNPEADVVADIERMEMEVRDVRRRLEQARHDADRRVLDRQLTELKEQIDFLRARLP